MWRRNTSERKDAYYKLMSKSQIKSYVKVLRSSVPKLTLDGYLRKKKINRHEVQKANGGRNVNMDILL